MAKKNKKNVELEIETVAYGSGSIARKDGMVYFVDQALPGDRVRARIKKKKRNYYEAITDEVIEPSPYRIEPECRHFGPCGGCKWQNLQYEQQLYWKRQHVLDSFERIAKIPVKKFKEPMPSEDIYHYRNKMEFSFGTSRWMTEKEIENKDEIEQKHFALGLHTPGRFDKVLDVEECKIQHPAGNKILNEIRNAAMDFGSAAHNLRFHDGFLRNLIIRSSHTSDELMTILVTMSPQEEADKKLLEWYEKEFPKKNPEVTTAIHAINDEISPVAVGKMNIIKGSGFITEKIMEIDFRISPFSFFQTNSVQLNRFVSLILDYAELNENQLVWDLYCGTGSITLPAAKRANFVYGFELEQSSVSDARFNAELNKIENVDFHCVDLHDKDFPELFNNMELPDVMFIDPPRAGMHKNLVGHIKNITPKRIVYVSCNPATQARDCGMLSNNYNVEAVHPVDMFPQTYHLESVALLERKDLK